MYLQFKKQNDITVYVLICDFMSTAAKKNLF
jgi:hypothetical protein